MIFVGILFTCVIPLFLYVNQVNSLYDQEVVGMRRIDQDREGELIEVYAFPVGDSLTELNVHIRNKCALEVRILRIWVNDTIYDAANLTNDLPLLLQGMSEATIGDPEHPIAISEGYIDVLVMTDRGNVFASFTNTIHSQDGKWAQGAYNFGIPNFITTGGTYDVTIVDDDDYTYPVVTIKSAPTAYRIIKVATPGTYTVTISSYTKTWVVYVNWEYPLASQIEIPPPSG